MPGRKSPFTEDSVSEVMQQRIHQRSRVVPRAGMHHHSGGLVHDNHIRVFIQDLERQFFGFGLQRRQIGRV